MRKLKIALAAGMLAALASTGLATAAHTVTANDHDTVAGNPQCASGFAFTLKLEDGENLANGTFGPIVISNYNGTSFNWAIATGFLNTYDANTVIVKGGPNAEVYLYTDPGDDSDQGLTAPINPNNGKFYGVSHISFCFDPKG